MVFSKDCDLLKALSTLLGQVKKLEKKKEQEIETNTTTDSKPSPEENMQLVAQNLNSRLHEQAKKFISDFKATDVYTTLNIDSMIKELDPVILQFIKLLTFPVRGSKRKLFEDDTAAKTIRHFYIVCVLLFNMNHACAPLHVSLSEAIVCHGGSQVLVQLMNRLGAVASLDTCNRLATDVVQTRLRTGIKPFLVPKMLTVVSVPSCSCVQFGCN